MYGLAYVMMFVVQMMPHFLAMLREKEFSGIQMQDPLNTSQTLLQISPGHPRRGATN